MYGMAGSHIGSLTLGRGDDSIFFDRTILVPEQSTLTVVSAGSTSLTKRIDACEADLRYYTQFQLSAGADCVAFDNVAFHPSVSIEFLEGGDSPRLQDRKSVV